MWETLVVLIQLAHRFLTSIRPRLLWKFCWDFGLAGVLAVRRFHGRMRGGRQFPPFLFLSITNKCNLHCQGCWVTLDPPYAELDLATIDRIVRESAGQGTRFFGILGGEPLLHGGLCEIFERHPRCYFQLFTNGTLLTREIAARLARAGNVTPLVSVEGDAVVSDQRRRGKRVYSRAMAGLDECLGQGLVTGVATSVCRSNMDVLVNEAYLDGLIARGVHYVWYYSYRPSGPDPCPELALDSEQLLDLRRFVVEQRCRKPIVIVDTYYDADGRALCPAAEGMSYHVNPWGDIEPCPPIQFAAENVHDGPGVVAQVEQSEFLAAFRRFAAGQTRGCVFMEHPDRLRRFMIDQGARDSTGRASGLAELGRLTPHPSQHQPDHPIPEKHWAYRFAKKHWFFGFGGYA